MTEPSQPEHDGRDDIAEGLKAAFGGEPPPKQSSVHRVLQRKTGSNLDLHLHDKDEESDVPVKIDEDAKALRDPSGRYQVLGEIGRGGVGVVYKGRDQDLGRDVAIKVLRPEHVSRPEILERFVEEAQIGGQLQHPGIVPVYEIGLQSGERPYFAMKLVKGHTLAELLARRKGPDDDRRKFLGIFEQICQTIAYAHARRVVHRDLKPQNVMLGSFGEVQVVDWGFAKVLPLAPMAEVESPEQRKASAIASVIATVRSDPKKGSHSVAGSMMGTPAYMPPEQALGDVEHLDQRSDVFGLGAILCEILTGQPPYLAADDDLVMQAARADLQGAYTRLEKCGADAVLVALCKQCLSPARQKRPESAKQVAEAVAQYLTSVEDRARQAQIHAAEAKVRARSTLMLSAAAMLVLALGGGGYLYVQREAQTRRDQANQRVATALNEANVRLGEARAKEPPDLALWSRAADAATQAGQLAGEADVAVEERSHASQLLAAVHAEQATAVATAARVDKDVAMQQRLLDVRVQRLDDQSKDYMVKESRRREQGYAAAFGEYLDGGDLTTMSREPAVQALSGRLAIELASGLDCWCGSRRYLGDHEPKDPKAPKSPSDPEVTARLSDLASTIDPDPWRIRLRTVLAAKDRDHDALVTLYREADLATLPVASLLLLAGALYDVADVPTAQAVYERACERFPANFACVFELGLLHENTGHFAQAEPYFRIAHALRPDMHEDMHQLGMALHGLGDFRAEEEIFRRLAELQPGNAHWPYHVGLALAAQGRLDEAIPNHQRAIELDPKQVSHYIGLSAAFSRMGKHDDSIAACRRALEVDPQCADAYTNLGGALVDLGRLDEAKASMQRAIELAPKDGRAYYNLGNFLKNRNQFEDAIALLRRAVELDPKDAWAHDCLGSCYVEVGRLDEAVASYRRAIEIDPKSVAPHYNLAIALGLQKKVDDSIASYRRAIELDPTDARYPMNLAHALLKQVDPDAALVSFRRAASLWSEKHDAYAVEWHANALRQIAKLEPVIERRDRQLATLRGQRESKDAGELYQAANLGFERGDWQLAIRCYQLALELDPNVAVVHFELGCAFDQLGRLDAAIASHERAIELDPKDARFHFNLAHCLLKHGELDDAIASFREFLELEPKAVAGWALLSNALSQSGETDEAITCARKAVELDPKNAMAHYFLGCNAQEQHHWDEAIAHYRATLETDPNHAEAHCNLAQCLENTGHLAEALQYYRRGHELGSKRPDWRYPSAEWVRTAEIRAALEAKLPALLEGKVKPKDNAERYECAIMAQMKEFNHASARWFAEAFAADPKLTDEPGSWYDAALSPVRAAAGRGKDAAQLDASERARLRKQALDWLRADLTNYAKKLETGKPEDRAAVQAALSKWQEEAELAFIRDSAALAQLPAEERDAFGRLWADVADLLRSR